MQAELGDKLREKVVEKSEVQLRNCCLRWPGDLWRQDVHLQGKQKTERLKFQGWPLDN